MSYRKFKLVISAVREIRVFRLLVAHRVNSKYLIAYSFKAIAAIAHQTNQPHLALSHCQAALTLSQELGIPLVKDCEELLAKIQEDLGE